MFDSELTTGQISFKLHLLDIGDDKKSADTGFINAVQEKLQSFLQIIGMFEEHFQIFSAYLIEFFKFKACLSIIVT